MSNDWKDYPRYKPASGKPLIETGNREGWEEIRDLGKLIGRGIGKLALAARSKLNRSPEVPELKADG